MIFFKYIVHALGSLWRNKLRSSLSILGIVIGIASVTFMMGLWEGMKTSLIANMSSGNDIITINKSGNAYKWDAFDEYGEDFEDYGGAIYEEYGEEPIIEWWSDVAFGEIVIGMWWPASQPKNRQRPKEVFTLDILGEITKNVPNVKTVVAHQYVNTGMMQFAGKDTWWEVYGVTADYIQGKGIEFVYGFWFTPEHFENASRVIIVGQDLVNENFAGANPIGKELLIDGTPFEIIGIRKKKDNDWESGYSMLMPITTAQKLYGDGKFESLEVYIKDVLGFEQTRKDVLYFLYKYSGISTPEEATFEIHSNAEIIENIQKSINQLTMFLGGIAGISLFVWGIGIMNVMLMGVIERTREIGIRKAIGAKKLDILFQFLVESTVMSVFGCVLALGVTSIGVYFVNDSGVLQNMMPGVNDGIVINFAVFQFASMVSIGMGVIFGILPAWKAARMKPIDALRFE